MEISTLLDALPELIRVWANDVLDKDVRGAEALGVTRQSFSKRLQNLETAKLDNLIELIRMLEKQSKNSPEITLKSAYMLTGKGFEK